MNTEGKLIVEVISVVGREETFEQFFAQIAPHLYGGYSIIGYNSLGEPGIDKKERFVIWIAGDEEDVEFDSSTQAMRLQRGDWGVRLFNDFDEALEYAQENYGLAEEKVDQFRTLEDLTEEFPEIMAAEKEQIAVLDSFWKTGRIQFVPAKYEGERVIAIVSATQGPDELRVTPFAIIVNDDLAENLELPGQQ